MFLSISFDWTITTTTWVNFLSFLAVAGVFKTIITKFRKYNERKEAHEHYRRQVEEQKEDRIINLFARFEALTYAFLLSGPNDNQEEKKKLYDCALKEEMETITAVRKARQAERERLQNEDNG